MADYVRIWEFSVYEKFLIEQVDSLTIYIAPLPREEVRIIKSDKRATSDRRCSILWYSMPLSMFYHCIKVEADLILANNFRIE